ncbi:RNase A-like domain-containing protein [Streptomyces sp. NPDC096079]|uniref:RNase A-like domain-containing protein n=1 Tax=Streptomyces sp. NPDC096079 TaxID=3155820 RepID=UPI00332B415C
MSTPTPGATQLPPQGRSPGTPAVPAPAAQQSPAAPGATAAPPTGTQAPPPMPPPAPPVGPIVVNGVLDVTPLHLYQVTDALAVEQHSFHDVAGRLVRELASYTRVGGKGSAAVEFSQEYLAVVGIFLETHAKTVVAIGGAAVGFNETANNFGAADAATHPQAPPFTPRGQPPVMFSEPQYGPATPLGDSGANPVEDFLDVLDGTVAGDVVRAAVEHALRAGRALEILPLPNYHHVREVAHLWRGYVFTAGSVDGQLIQTIASVTDTSQGPWYDAMRWFCSSLWGTTSWGQTRFGNSWAHDTSTSGGMNHPVLGVLTKTASTLDSALVEYARAAETVRTTLRNILHKAITDALQIVDPDKSIWDNIKKVASALGTLGVQVLAQILANIDVSKVNAAVDDYEFAIRNQKVIVGAQREALEEARRSVPTFQSQMARAEAFGARALFEFSPKFLPIDENAQTTIRRYPIELASMEGVSDAHTIDKHVGLTPDQLAARLRDQAKPGGGPQPPASSFENLYSAQRFTQAALDDTQMGRKINAWLKNQREKWAEHEEKLKKGEPSNYDPANRTFDDNFDFPEVTGLSVAAGDSAPQEVKGIHFTLRFDPTTQQFVVLSSYPAKERT